jgi:hypothetical protein
MTEENEIWGNVTRGYEIRRNVISEKCSSEKHNSGKRNSEHEILGNVTPGIENRGEVTRRNVFSGKFAFGERMQFF